MDSINDKNPQDYYGETPFHYAAKYGHLGICEYVIDKIDWKNPTDYKGLTPLHNAAERGHLSVCQLILDRVETKNPNSANNMWTPLHFAARNGRLEVCKLIIENILEKDPWKIVEPVADMGLTPLNLAESYQSPEFLSAMKNMCYPDLQEENKGED